MTDQPQPHAAPTRRTIASLGWIPDLPDWRDLRFAVPAPIAADLPPTADLRGSCPPGVYDQGALGSCTANAIAAAVECARITAGRASTIPSRLFIYYNERVIERTVRLDSGASIRDGIKTACKQGVCDETLWPYDIEQFTTRPSAPAYTAAAAHRVTAYERIGADLDSMRGALASGHPFVSGFTVYDQFQSAKVAKSGVLNLPLTRESVLGGHAVLTVGYNDASRRFLVRNSWGPRWGQSGYFTVPYDYWSNPGLAGDRWAVTAIA